MLVLLIPFVRVLLVDDDDTSTSTGGTAYNRSLLIDFKFSFSNLFFCDDG